MVDIVIDKGLSLSAVVTVVVDSADDIVTANIANIAVSYILSTASSPLGHTSTSTPDTAAKRVEDVTPTKVFMKCKSHSRFYGFSSH